MGHGTHQIVSPNFADDPAPVTAVEVCCGSAGLSAAIRRLGIDVFAIDHQANRHRTKVRPILLDLTLLSDVQVFWAILHQSQPRYIHMGLPCGTCSRAREKALPSSFGPTRGPVPLRDADHLFGKPHLTQADQTKVIQANRLYSLAVEILEFCMTHAVLVSIENPLRSWLWQLLAQIVQASKNPQLIQYYASLEHVVFAACAHGSSREKYTKLLATPGLFDTLAAACPGDHVRSSWAPFKVGSQIIYPTAAEAEYHPVLCKRMAQCVHDALTAQGYIIRLAKPLKELLRLSVGLQSFRQKPLVPEFKAFVHLPEPYQASTHKLLAAPPTGGSSAEQRAETRRAEDRNEDDWVQDEGAHDLLDANDDTLRNSKRQRLSYKYGVWHTPEEFMEQAKASKHPVDSESYLHPITKSAIEHVLSHDQVSVARDRLKAVLTIRQLRDQFEKEENRLKASMHPEVAKRLSTKPIKLFEHLLSMTNFPDTKGVVSLLSEGIPLVGHQDPPPSERRLLVPAVMTVDELEKSAKWRRKALMGSSRNSKPEDEETLIESASEEARLGFLDGPYDEAAMTDRVGSDKWLLNPRFVLYQGDSRKVRVIDDAKISSLNAAYSSTIKLQLQDGDYVTSMLSYAMRSQGTSNSQGVNWKGKTFDLSKAYKQLAVHPDHHHLAIVGFPAEGKWKFYRSIAAPFGCTGSVYGFVRVSKAIWWVLSSLLKAPMSHYFDDFPTFDLEPNCNILAKAVSACLDLLGWDPPRQRRGQGPSFC